MSWSKVIPGWDEKGIELPPIWRLEATGAIDAAQPDPPMTDQYALAQFALAKEMAKVVVAKSNFTLLTIYLGGHSNGHDDRPKDGEVANSISVGVTQRFAE